MGIVNLVSSIAIAALSFVLPLSIPIEAASEILLLRKNVSIISAVVDHGSSFSLINYKVPLLNVASYISLIMAISVCSYFIMNMAEFQNAGIIVILSIVSVVGYMINSVLVLDHKYRTYALLSNMQVVMPLVIVIFMGLFGVYGGYKLIYILSSIVFGLAYFYYLVKVLNYNYPKVENRWRDVVNGQVNSALVFLEAGLYIFIQNKLSHNPLLVMLMAISLARFAGVPLSSFQLQSITSGKFENFKIKEYIFTILLVLIAVKLIVIEAGCLGFCDYSKYISNSESLLILISAAGSFSSIVLKYTLIYKQGAKDFVILNSITILLTAVLTNIDLQIILLLVHFICLQILIYKTS